MKKTDYYSFEQYLDGLNGVILPYFRENKKDTNVYSYSYLFDNIVKYYYINHNIEFTRELWFEKTKNLSFLKELYFIIYYLETHEDHPFQISDFNEEDLKNKGYCDVI